MTWRDGWIFKGAHRGLDSGAARPGIESSDHEPTESDHTLHEDDRRALDALIENGLEVERVAEPLRARARGVAAVLGLLDPGSVRGLDGERRELLVDMTLARVGRQRRLEQNETGPVLSLSPNDEDAVEQLIASAFDPHAVASSLRPRAQRAAALLSMLDGRPAPAKVQEDLVARTLMRVQSAAEQERALRRIGARATSGESELSPRSRFGMRDLVSVAALLLIAGAVIAPMVSGVRSLGQRFACQSNLGSLAQAFGLYAGDSRDSLPMASASTAGMPWWNVGKVQESNSANLFTLARTGYTRVPQLACPTNARATQCRFSPGTMDWQCLEEVSFSFQNLFASDRPRWSENGTGPVVVLVDRSPVVPLAVRGFRINPLSNSPNHDHRGQNALFSDGSARWLRSPVLESGDNIWLPRLIEDALSRRQMPAEADPLKGTESPAGRDDSFVGP